MEGRGVVCHESHFGKCPLVSLLQSQLGQERGFALQLTALCRCAMCSSVLVYLCPACGQVGSSAHSRSHPPLSLPGTRSRRFSGDHCSLLCFPAGPKVLSHSAVSMETALLAGISFGGRGCR